MEVYAQIDYTDDKDYVEPLLLSALHNHLPSILLQPPPTSTSKSLTWTSYESLDFPALLSSPTSLFNAYIIRKALIRKHYLLTTLQNYTTKYPHSILKKAAPVSVAFEVDYAEFLDEALVEAYELLESLEKNEGCAEKEWWILKPGMSDRGAGIRLFSTMEELQAIFEEWEEDSDEEDEDARSDGEDKEKKGDGIITSRLRHFVAQTYIPPVLLPPKSPSSTRKFHIRTYVLAYSALKIYVYKNMLALFAAKEYTPPSPTEQDLSAHLTNTCLQSGIHDGSVIPFWKLPNSFDVPEEQLEKWYAQIREITSEVFKAAVSGGRIHFQPLPNAFEIFGFDFLIGEDGDVRILEVNAFPDFKQTGEEEKELVAGLFDGVVGVIKPFFGGEEVVDERMDKVLDMQVGVF
ncbi:hypothetical protein TWF481_001227 [Arthrobotrys musiformis]|uniref:Tubulin-tyrosine ligase n=1 Tax=Arthrobotrys musiformis TaxID=47236 RepID=A0AAV9WPY5_9PEZI